MTKQVEDDCRLSGKRLSGEKGVQPCRLQSRRSSQHGEVGGYRLLKLLCVLS
jgi:hypothetical protein